MVRVGHIEKMGTGIKKMRDLVRKAGLKPIKFEFSSFTTVIFYRKPLSEEKFISENKNFGINFIEKLSDILNIRSEKINILLQVLTYIENDAFSKGSFSIKYNIPLRTLTRYITNLKKQKLILFEGSKRKGQYKVTEKYKSLKKLSTIKK